MSKIFSNIQSFLPVLTQLKADNKKIISTNGCWDIFHHGHLQLLKSAKEKGDTLIVLINTDESIRRIKEGKPCNQLSVRMEMLAELACVDYVVAFDETTPVEALKIIKPYCSVKGREKTYIDTKEYPEINIVDIEWVSIVKWFERKIIVKTYPK